MMYLNSFNIADEDECCAGSSCHINSTCSDSLGSFNCSCNDGFTGNGTFCSGILSTIVFVFRSFQKGGEHSYFRVLPDEYILKSVVLGVVLKGLFIYYYYY